MSSPTQERIRILVLGDRGVGKTTFLEELCGLGPEWYYKDLVVDGKQCIMDICDNQGEWIDLWPQMAQCVILIYSVTSPSSFESILAYHEMVLQVKVLLPGADWLCPFVLVENKCDAEKREVSTEEGALLVGTLGCPFWETSLETAKDMSGMLEDLVRSVRAVQVRVAAEKARREDEGFFRRLLRCLS